MCLPPFRAPLFACLLIIGWASTASADEIRLKNGDRYTGKVLSLAKGVLRFDTGHGALDVPWADVTVATIDTPIVVSAAGAPPRTAATLSLADGQVTVAPGTTVAAGTISGLTRPDGPATLVGGASAGLLSTGGNTDVNSLRLDGDIVAKAGQNRYTAGGVLNRAVDQGIETARNATGTGRYDRFLNPRLYTNVNALFTKDRFRDLDLRTALGLGLGYQVADSARARVGVEGGYGYVKEQFFVAADDSYHAVRDTVTVDVFAAGKRVTFFHHHDGYFGFTGGNNLFVQTHNGVRVGLGRGLVTTIQYDVDYDQSPAPGRATTDRTLGVTFGYRF